MCMSVWAAVMFLHECLVPAEVKTECPLPWNWSYEVMNHYLGMGIEPDSSARILLTSEPSLQPSIMAF